MMTIHGTGRREVSRTLPSDRLMARMNPTLFYSLGAACLLESASGVYARRLLATLAGDGLICQWIAATWLPEKLDRASVLQRYAGAVWPEFDWAAAAAELQSVLTNPRGAAAVHGPAHESLAHSIAAAQTSLFYRCLSRWAEDQRLRELAHEASIAEGVYFGRFRNSFERSHPREKPGFWRGLRETLARVRNTRDATVYKTFDILQGHWSGTPPFPDLSYGEFLARAGSVARRDGMLTWRHRLLLRAWFREPVLRASVNTRRRAAPATQPPCRVSWMAPAVPVPADAPAA